LYFSLFLSFFSGTVSHGVRIYDLRQTGGSSEPIFKLESRTSVNSLSWSINGHLLAGGCESGQIYLWDVRQPSNEIKIFKTQDKNPIQVITKSIFLIEQVFD
jgi:WD40 repeat protein